MSTESSARRGSPADGDAATRTRGTVLGVPARHLAAAATLVLLGTYLAVIYDVTDVVGRTDQFLLLAAGTLVVATVVGRTLRPRYALALTLAFLGAGFGVYVLALPKSQLALLSVGQLASDSAALLTGLSVLRLLAADVWALAATPAPTFLAWYLVVRGRVAPAVAVAGGGLGMFVLTGDADAAVTLLGVTAGVVALGLDAVDRYGGAGGQLDALAVVVAAMVVLTATVTVVPGAGGSTVVPSGGTAADPTVEASLVNARDSVSIVGSISLSPEVRFEVESPRPSYWQTASYDRYTGHGWVRTGGADKYTGGRLEEPPGPTRLVRQTVSPATPLDAMPAAWRPIAVSGAVANDTLVTQQGYLYPTRTVGTDENYTVTSAVPQYTAASLRRTGTDYPPEIRQRYLSLPDSTSPRVGQKADEITADAETPYDKAVAVENWLEDNREYSLRVQRPEGDVAESFLFEMDAGYCTYYATTMVVLLREEGVPARFVTGYTTGQRVGDDRYVVRGLDSHAWVEVYFEDVGWVRFDPTPAGPRRAAESDRLAEARDAGETGVDTDGTRPDATQTPEITPVPVDDTTANDSNATAGTPAGPGVAARLGVTPSSPTPADSTDGALPSMPSREVLLVGLAALVGVVAGARRSGLRDRVLWTARVAYQRRTDDPDADVERAYDRLERVLARTYRPRRPGEPVRHYLDALSRVGVDDRLVGVARLYERARYGNGVTRAEADEAMAAVDAAVRARLPVVRRWAD